MHGDHLPGDQTRDAALAGEPDVPDLERYAGVLREQITYDGTKLVHATQNTPWSAATADDGKGHQAFRVAISTSESRTALSTEPATYRTTKTTTTYDSRGLPIEVDDQGDLADTDDQLCTRNTYVHDTPKNIIGLISRSETVSVRCSLDPARPKDVVSDVRTYYDGASVINDQTLTRGLATAVKQVKGYTGSTADLVTAQTSYDNLGRPTTVTDPLGRVTSTAYTPSGNGPLTGTTVTAPKTGTYAHVTTTAIHPAWGASTSVTDDGGRVTAATHDALGRVSKVWRPGRAQATQTPSTTYSYAIGKTQGSGVVNAISTGTLNSAGTAHLNSTMLYDGLLRARQTQSPSLSRDNPGVVLTDTIYDSRGLVELNNEQWATTGTVGGTLVVPTEHVPARTRHLYDGVGRETTQIFEVQGDAKWRTTTAYAGDRVTVTPPAGGTKQTTVSDARGNTTELIQYTGAGAVTQTTKYGYDPAGRLTTMTDPSGNQWVNVYDLLGRQTSAKDPDKGTTTTAYDDAGQVLSTTDALGNTLTYTYDALGRRTKMSQGSTKLATWVYDTVSVGLQTSASRWADGTEYSDLTAAVDAAGRPLKRTVSIPASEVGLAGAYSTEYTYTPGGQVASVKYPKLATPVSGTATTVLAAETVSTQYDGLSQAQLMTGGLGWGVYVAQARYSEYGEPLMMDLGGGYAQMVNYDYETGTRRLSHSWLVRENITGYAQDVTYKYDDAGNVSHAFDRGTAGKDYQCYEYDGLRRLTEAWTPSTANCSTAPTTAALGGGAPYWSSYTYDAIGNRLTDTKHASSGDATTTYTHPVSGAGVKRPHATTRTVTTIGAATTTNSYVFDATGNTTTRTIGTSTQTLTWNSEGDLSTLKDASGTDTYLYSADGDRLIRRDGSKKTLYLPGQELTYTSASTVGTAVRYYTFAGKTIASRTGDSLTAARVLVSDTQNSANLIIATSSNTLAKRYQDPFGNPRGSRPAWQGDHTFLDKPTDTTGLIQIGARYYDAKMGSFISVDPLQDLNDPQQWNGYSYAGGNPSSASDPTGLLAHPVGDWGTTPVHRPTGRRESLEHPETTTPWYPGGVRTGESAIPTPATEPPTCIVGDASFGPFSQLDVYGFGGDAVASAAVAQKDSATYAARALQARENWGTPRGSRAGRTLNLYRRPGAIRNWQLFGKHPATQFAGKALGIVGVGASGYLAYDSAIDEGLETDEAVGRGAVAVASSGAGLAAAWWAGSAVGSAVGTAIPVPGLGTAAGFVVGGAVSVGATWLTSSILNRFL